MYFLHANNQHSHEARSGEQGGCVITSQHRRWTRFCTPTRRCCVAKSWSKTYPVQVVYIEEPAKPTLATVYINRVHWPPYQFVRNCQYNSISYEGIDVNDFQSNLTTRCSFFHRSRLGTPVSILSFHLWRQMNASIDSQPFKYTAFTSPTSHMVGVRNTHDPLVFIEHIWNPLCTNFSFPLAVCEDTIITYWRDSHCRRNCCAWHAVLTYKRQTTFSMYPYPLPVWGTTGRDIVCLSLPFLMTFIHQRTASYEEASVPTHSLKYL
jgi:hypothetical protein